MELKKCKLSDLCVSTEIGIYGIPAPAEAYSTEKVRYLRISDISDDGNLLDNDKKSVSDDEIEKYYLKEDDIVFARTGNSTGRAYLYNPQDGALAFAGFLIKYGLDKNKINPLYMKYFTISNYYKQWVKNLSNGSTRGNISAQTFADCPIIFPEKDQQDFLATVLSTLDRKISLNRSINAELERMAKEVYDYWFVQFDFPDEHGRPYKSSGGAMVYNPVLKREVPEGWEVVKLSNILDLLKDGTHNPPKRIEAGIPLLTGTMFGDNFLEYDKATYISEEDYQQIHKKYFPKEFDIIITKIGTLGNVNLLTSKDVPIAIHCNSALLRFPNKWGNFFPFLMCKSQLFYSRLKAVKGQSIQEFASLDKIGSINVEIPNEKTISTFNNTIEPIIRKMIKLRDEIEELTALRDELLPLLMTGQVGV